MQAALIKFPAVKKNRRNYVKELLVNSNKAKNFRADSVDTNYTLLYYTDREDRRVKVDEYKVALTVAEVDALLREEPIEQVVPLYVTSRRKLFGFKKTVNRIEYVNIDSWVLAYDNTDAVTSTVFIDEGAFGIVELQTNHTIDQISSRASTSASYSESGM